jgi:hypothetical protein
MGHPPIDGAYTELYAGLSSDITIEKTGSLGEYRSSQPVSLQQLANPRLVIPFGRIAEIRNDFQEATRSEEESGNGTAAKFWNWTEDQIKQYV